ncbi:MULTISPECIES: hypothetical protein [Pseudomonas]|jgi:hypothetical protein|uniref:DUF1963 domain-containing protein n=2 Tax=Pseudomonas fluorescens TaxID=294 RepID=A0ABY1T9S2_PSEFL|nr:MULTISPECIES: hypothetical protein [Pseudomonas]MEA3168835.1 hypothetical protein [Pseudomonas sp.]MBC8781903.1 hypothetical protein [Pseudomonas fluorescens]MBK5546349.1 hypothetical protein [Pseudomonas sp. TH04]MCI4603637.1 hypothetical protein [Pseudomonas fluorescens]NNB68662.1 hypothetical protein [Pseudomonas fluorescens]
MGINQIILSEQDHNLGQIGGGAWLTDLALWPKDPKTGQLMLPVMMMTPAFLGVSFIPAGMALTVFVCVERNDETYTRSSVRQLTVHQQSEMDKLKLGLSCVLLHTLATCELTPTTLVDPIPRTYIAQQPLTPEQMEEELEDLECGAGISKVLGRPAWLQDPLYESPRYYFLAQLIDADIAKISPSHEGIFGGGIGYIFADNRAKKMKEGDTGGYFLVQFT